jgi:nitroreductase
MTVLEAIQTRRSIKRFTDQPVAREHIETLVAAAAAAPNHHLTQPLRVYVLGPEARHAYGLALGARKARKLEDAEAGKRLQETVASEHRALPAMLACAMTMDASAEKREEDYASVMMGIENLALAATELGLGTHIKTGAVMEDPAARAAANVREGERIVAIVNVGYPADVPPQKNRRPPAELTTWVP